MSLRRVLLFAVIVVAIGFIHRRSREKAREVSSGTRPIEAVGTQTVG